MKSFCSSFFSTGARTLFFLLPALVFGIWGCLLFRLDLSQALVNLQSPRFHPYTLAAAGTLLGLALLYPLLFLPPANAPLPAWPVLAKNAVLLLGLLLPAFAYLLLPPAFGTPAALLDRVWANAGQGFGGTPGGRVDPAVVRSFILDSDPHTPLPLSPVDLLIVQKEKELQDVLLDRKISLLGQWLPLADNPANEFRLVRLVMVCCAADARPVGIIVQGEANGAERGSWFKATGRLGFDDPRETIILQADSVEPVDPPEEIFLY